MGRTPKPDKLKMMQGTARADRMNFEQPEFDLVLSAEAPEYLSEKEKRIWNDLVPQFIRSKIFTTIDEGTVAMLCVELAEYWSATFLIRDKVAKLGKNGKVIVDRDVAYLKQLRQQSFNNAKALMIKFGMSPVDRQKMKITDPTDPKNLKDALPPKPSFNPNPNNDDR